MVGGFCFLLACLHEFQVEQYKREPTPRYTVVGLACSNHRVAASQCGSVPYSCHPVLLLLIILIVVLILILILVFVFVFIFVLLENVTACVQVQEVQTCTTICHGEWQHNSQLG